MGCEEAIALAQDGKNVTIVEMTDVIAGEADGGLKQMIDEKIALYRIPVLTGHSCVRITDEGAAVKIKTGRKPCSKQILSSLQQVCVQRIWRQTGCGKPAMTWE